MSAGRKAKKERTKGCLKQCIILRQSEKKTLVILFQPYCRTACSLLSSCIWQVVIKEQKLYQRLCMTSNLTLCLHPVSRLTRHIRQQRFALNILIYPALSLVQMEKPRQVFSCFSKVVHDLDALSSRLGERGKIDSPEHELRFNHIVRKSRISSVRIYTRTTNSGFTHSLKARSVKH